MGKVSSLVWSLARYSAAPAPTLLFFLKAEDGIREMGVIGVQTCALPISPTEATMVGLMLWLSVRSTSLKPIVPVSVRLPAGVTSSVTPQIGRASCRERV